MTFIFINVAPITKRQIYAYLKRVGWRRVKKRDYYNRTRYMCSWTDVPLYINWKNFDFPQEQIINQLAEAHGCTELAAYLKILGKQVADE